MTNRMIALLVIGCVLSGCAPSRPASVPADAVYSGGSKGGRWLDCDAEGDGYRCDVYTQNGRLYQSGSFGFLRELPECFPGFVLADYRFNGGYLTPRLVRFEGQELFLAEAVDANALEASVAERFEEVYQVRPTSVTLTPADECGNRNYEAAFSNLSDAITGRVWAGAFFQVWRPRDQPPNSEPLVLPN